MLKGHLFRLELEIPKVRKKSKEIELEFTKHRYESPMNKRRRSLMDRLLGIEEEFPISLAELLIDFMGSRSPQDKAVCSCSSPMKMTQCKFSRLPNVMLVKIGRVQKDLVAMNPTTVECPESWDMNGFVVDGYKGPTHYDLISTLCFTPEGEFVAVARNCKNKQRY